jgi:hypothetical protein
VVVVLCFQSVPINTKIVSSNLNPVHGEYLDSNIAYSSESVDVAPHDSNKKYPHEVDMKESNICY